MSFLCVPDLIVLKCKDVKGVYTSVVSWFSVSVPSVIRKRVSLVDSSGNLQSFQVHKLRLVRFNDCICIFKLH